MKNFIRRLGTVIATLSVIMSAAYMLHSVFGTDSSQRWIALLGILGGAMGIAFAVGLYTAQSRAARGRRTVFISHSATSDAIDLGRRLGRDFTSEGYKVILPSDAGTPGERIDQARLASLIKEADYIIAVISEGRPSGMFERELKIAKSRGKMIFPIIVGANRVPEIVVDYTSMALPDIAEAESYKSAFRILSGAVRRAVERSDNINRESASTA